MTKAQSRNQGSISSTFYVQLLQRRFQRRKKTVKLSVSFYAFGIYERKSCVLNVGEIDTRFSGKKYLTIKLFFSLCLRSLKMLNTDSKINNLVLSTHLVS